MSTQPAVRWAVILDASAPQTRQAYTWKHDTVHEVRDDASLISALQRTLDAGVEVAVVQGDDRFLARLATAHRQRFAGHPTALRFLPMDLSDTGASSCVAVSLGVESKPGKLARKVARAAKRGKFPHKTRQALRVTSSLEPTWQLAFSVGTGQLYNLFEHLARSSTARLGWLGRSAAALGALAQELVALDGEDLSRIAINTAPRQDMGWALLSSLERSWFGLSLSREGGPHLLSGPNLLGMTPTLARARAPLAALRGSAERFERAHFDHLHGYVLDGALVQPTRPHILQVAEGVSVPMTTL